MVVIFFPSVYGMKRIHSVFMKLKVCIPYGRIKSNIFGTEHGRQYRLANIFDPDNKRQHIFWQIFLVKTDMHAEELDDF